MKNENYITVQGWMINELGLSGNELLVYALVYGFSQDGESEFNGSLSYVAGVIGKSTDTASNILKKLEQDGLIEGEKREGYTTLWRVYKYPPKKQTPRKIQGDSPKNSEGTPRKIGGDNNSNNNRDNNRISINTRAREFEDEARECGVLDEAELEKFVRYWTEPNRSKTKMRCEMEKTWEMKGRLVTWRDRAWKGGSGNSKPAKKSVYQQNLENLQGAREILAKIK